MVVEAGAYYFLHLAAAFVRGRLGVESEVGKDHPELFGSPLEELSEQQCAELFELGTHAGLQLHKFKRTMALQRVAHVIGMLRAMAPEDLLDIGSGRGTFLWPMLDALPELKVTCVDIISDRVRDINAVRLGGMTRVAAMEMDMHCLKFADNQFDVTTALEVLEHVEKPDQAIKELVRVTRNFLIVSVPKHEDDNPEHIHLFDEAALRSMMTAAGARNVRVQYTLKEMVAVAAL